ncbi:hypothetical protein AYL99_05563 [Fonsecaea erecta]|uniref:Major facilitator superfamily (MFS) profile domain-containing protein n=1 Tax=Fonsecaea erecta TaxID=1367422 RepID=A0A178ZM49_9EURO|nr:hypothetical protein AYL99_05563 [Fonsecaea erecta]OAP60561.1 hypothetical protein AYL99_05563 [Fonsecaea erecta]
MKRFQRNSQSHAAGDDAEKDQEEAGVGVIGAPQKRTVMTFDGEDDLANPQNWPTQKKAGVTMIISLIAFIVGFGSSIDSAVLPQASRHFGVSEVTESLATTLYLVGFGFGATFSGPLSEERGRNPVYLITFTLYCCWILGAALAPNIGAKLVFRFLAGTCGSTPFTAAGGTLGDIFDHVVRGQIFPFFACIAFLGPMLAPVVGGYVGQAGMDWRWVEWITFLISCGVLALMVFFLPETDAKEILRGKAQALQARNGASDVQAPANLPRRPRLTSALLRPCIILFTEPVIAIFTAYLTLVYSVAFCFFSSAQYIFGQTYGFHQGSTHLMFLSISTGLIVCALATPLFGTLVAREHRHAAVSRGKDHAGPEAMLWWAMIGGPLLPISVFWMAWSSRRSVSYWSPMISAAFFGFSMLCLFVSTYAYIMQRFTSVAASALVSNTFVRYVVAGTVVVLSIPMFENLGVHHALTVFAALSCLFTPVPFLLYVHARQVEGTMSVGVVGQ